jgi:MAC/Perforin domain
MPSQGKAGSAIPSQLSMPILDEYQLGWGVNVVSGALGEFAVKGLQTASWNDFSEMRDIQVFSSSSDFAFAIQRFALFQACILGSSLSASGDFLLSTDVNETCLSLEADSTARTRIELLDLGHSSPQLDSAAVALLKQDPAGFLNRYGTHFIGGFIYGGYFTGTLNLTTSSLSLKAQLASDFKETINLWLANQSATKQFNASLSETQVQYSLDARATISGQPVTANIADPDALLAEVNNFASDLQNQPGQGIRLIAICYSWDVLPQVVQVLNSLPQDKQKLFQQTIQPAVQLELVGELARLNYLQKTVNTLLSNQSGPPTTQWAQLEEISGDITAGVSKIQSLDVNGLVNLDMQSVKQYEVAASIEQRISSLA